MSSLFYADDSRIESLDHEWLQNTNPYFYNLFRDCTSLKPNNEKTEAISCHPGAIWKQCSMESYKRRYDGTRETYNKRKRKRTVCTLPDCSKYLALGSLQSHLCTQHGIDVSGTIIAKSEVLAPCLYKLSYIQQSDHSRQNVPCPVEDCRYLSSTPANL